MWIIVRPWQMFFKGYVIECSNDMHPSSVIHQMPWLPHWRRTTVFQFIVRSAHPFIRHNSRWCHAHGCTEGKGEKQVNKTASTSITSRWIIYARRFKIKHHHRHWFVGNPAKQSDKNASFRASSLNYYLTSSSTAFLTTTTLLYFINTDYPSRACRFLLRLLCLHHPLVRPIWLKERRPFVFRFTLLFCTLFCTIVYCSLAEKNFPLDWEGLEDGSAHVSRPNTNFNISTLEVGLCRLCLGPAPPRPGAPAVDTGQYFLHL